MKNTKICTKCKIEKDKSKFHKKKKSKDGHKSRCKICRSLDMKKYYLELGEGRREHIKEYKKKYNKIEKNKIAKREASRKYRESEEGSLKRKEYRKTEKGRESKKKTAEKWIKNNPLKYKTHWELNGAVRYGKIIKPKHCPICKRTNCVIQGHHDDYSKPLDVVWACRWCHPKLDEERRKKELSN